MANQTAVAAKVVRAALRACAPAPSDGELLRRYAEAGDEDAFAALVRRHGAMVLSVCQRSLPGAQDAEDACQATFLVLVRKARSQPWEPSLANWLYTTARKVARNARVTAQRRVRREGRVAVPEAVSPVDQMTGRELLATLDEELDRLPARYRAPLVLCYLEGLTRDEAASRLGLSPATLKSQLERGRGRLGDALARRGCAVGALAVLVGSARASSVSPALVTMILRAAADGAPPAVAALVEGAFPMVFGKKTIVALALLIGLAGAGVGIRQLPAGAQEKPTATGAAERPKPVIENVVTGRVLDAAGQPVPKAAIYLFGRRISRAKATAERVATADAEGRFRCEVPPAARLLGASLVAVAPGSAPGWVSLAGPPGEKTIRFAEDLPIRGRLLDLEGKPVGGATVRLLSVGESDDGDLQPVCNAIRVNPEHMHLKKQVAALAPAFGPETKTGADGRFDLKGVGKGRVAVLRFEARGLEAARVHVVNQPGFDPKSVRPVPGERERMGGFARDLYLHVYASTFTHTARPSHDITGTVTDAVTGKPVAGVTLVGTADPVMVASFGPSWGNTVEVKTGKDGRFVLSGLPKAARRFLHVQPGDNPYLDRLVEVKDVEALKVATADIKLDRCVVIEGQLTDRAKGTPVVGQAHWLPLKSNPILEGVSKADVQLYTYGLRVTKPTGMWADTDAAGRFKLRVPHGPGVVLARADTGRDPEARYTAIRVEKEDRKYLSKRNTDPTVRRTNFNPAAKTRDRSEDDESFATGVSSWPLRWENGYAMVDAGPKDEVVKAHIRFDAGQAVRGKVVGSDGKPVTGAEVLGLLDTDEMVPTTLKGDTFTAHALAAGRPREMIFLHEGKKLVGMIKVHSTDRDPVVKMVPWATITGRVLTPEGKPAARAEVSFQFIDGLADGMVRQKLYRDKPRSTLRTDDEGRFRLEGMFPGLELQVFARTPGLSFSRSSDPVIPRAGEAVSVGDITLPSSRR